jgi:DNA processing protein
MTMMWNVPVADIDRAIAPLRPNSTAEDRLATFADAAWSFLVEPGDRVAGALVRRFGSSEALARIVARPAASTLADDELSATDIAEALARWEPRLETPALFRSLTSAATLGITLVRDSDDAWPDGLVDLGDNGPRVLWVRGQIEALPSTSTSVAIVGARASTGYGEHVAMDFAAGFVSRGYSVVSGGAYGIDGMAHRATLACGGTTVAVMAGGLDNLYPSGHEELLKRIMNTGAVASEVAPGGAPTRWRFLQRNRLIAAMAGGTVVIEAGYRSGSLNTATHARDLDRPLGVVPGPITSGQSAGCHRLLRTNPAAQLVTSVADVIELMTGSLVDDEFESRDADDTVRVLDALSNSPRTAKSIAKRSGLAESVVVSQLRLLDAEGRAVQSEKGWSRPT